MSGQPDSMHRPALSELLAADKATRAAAAAVDQWLDLYRRAAGETLSEPGLDLLLKEALEAIARLLGADAASLLLANEDGSALVSRAAFGLVREVDVSLSIPAGAGVSGPILASGEPRVIDDLTQANPVSDVLRSSGQRSYVGVPLVSGGRIFGVLHATRRRVSAFDRDDVQLLTRLAEPIAAAIERVQILEAERLARQAAERATERVRGLQRMTAALASAGTAGEICQIIIHEAVPGSSEGGERAIWMLRGSRLVLIAGLGLSAEYPEIPLDPSLPAAENLREGRPLFVETRAELARRWPVLADGPTSSFAGLPLIVEEQRIGLMAVGFREDHVFAPDEREYLAAVAEQAAAALARAEARRALQDARDIADSRRAQLDFLVDASERLGMSLNLDVTLQAVADLAVPRIADRCVLYLIEDDTTSKRLLAPELNADEMQLFAETESSLSAIKGVGAVIRTGRPEYIEEIDDQMLVADAKSPEHLDLLRRVGFGGLLIVPLRARGKVLGALVFANRKGRLMGKGDRVLGEELSARAAMAIDNARLYSAESHIARHLAQALLPAGLPTIEGFDMAVRYQAGSARSEVGGDFYDVLQTGDDEFILLIGDVQGKGVEAAAVTGLARHTVRACAQTERDPALLLQQLNRMIIRNILESGRHKERAWSARLCTAAIVRMVRVGGQWSATVSSAGHPLPLLRRADRSVVGLGQPGLVLGVHDDARYADSIVKLDPASVLVLYTDGVSDRYAESDVFGSEGIAEVLSKSEGSATQVTQDIVNASLMREASHDDDMVVLTIRIK